MLKQNKSKIIMYWQAWPLETEPLGVTDGSAKRSEIGYNVHVQWQKLVNKHVHSVTTDIQHVNTIQYNEKARMNENTLKVYILFSHVIESIILSDLSVHTCH